MGLGCFSVAHCPAHCVYVRSVRQTADDPCPGERPDHPATKKRRRSSVVVTLSSSSHHTSSYIINDNNNEKYIITQYLLDLYWRRVEDFVLLDDKIITHVRKEWKKSSAVVVGMMMRSS